MCISGISKQRRRHILYGMTVFFVVVGTVFTLPYQRGTDPYAAIAEGFSEGLEATCAENGVGWCETATAYYVVHDVEIPSEYHFSLDKPIIVENGARLTIGKGVRFIFTRGGPETYPLGLIAVDGAVFAQGTEEDPIIFAKEDDDTEYTLGFFGARVTFDHVRIEGGGQGTSTPIFPVFLQRMFGTVFADTIFDVVPAVRFEGGVVMMDNTIISGSGGADIFLPGGEQRTVTSVPDSSLRIEHSDFGCDTDIPAILNGNGPAYGDPSYPSVVTLRDNWYGSADGPRAFDHFDDRTGKEIIGPVYLDGFSAQAHMERCASNVLFLPGLKASRLYMRNEEGREDTLWPPTLFSDDISDLALEEDGYSKNEVYTADVLESAGLTDYYASFLDDLERKKETYVINDFLPFAYDWRMSVHDVAYGSTPYSDDVKSLSYETDRLARSSKSGKVTIVAHSNGGLIAKELLKLLEEQAEIGLIDRVILVGTPQMGTPKSILSLLYGYDEELVHGILASRKNVRELAENMPGAYGLLPSDTYFDRAKEPIVTFSYGEYTRVRDFYDAYGGSISDRDKLDLFLTGEGDRREKPEKSEITLENVLRRNLLDAAQADRRILDAWTIPSDIEVIQIAGWGLDTISGIRYAEKEKMTCLFPKVCFGTGEYEAFYEPKFTVDGDAIVTAPSALMLPESENVKQYWVDLWDYNDNFPDKDHANFLEMSFFRDFFSQLLEHQENNSDLPEYIRSSRPSDYENAKPRIRMSLYSPLDVSLVDHDGNRTGTVRIEENGEEYVSSEQHIPGSSFLNLDERKYISFPAGVPVDIRLNGYADGAYTLRFEEIRLTEAGEEVVSRTTFKDLPTVAGTTVTLSVPEAGLSELSILSTDLNGDGETDYTVEPVANGIATFQEPVTDTGPPETTLGLAGQEGMNGWFLGDVTVMLSAIDDGGSVASTEYSLDDEASWEPYREPFILSTEGRTSVSYRSTDEVGNVEETKQAEIRIDRMPPIARIGFDLDNRDIVVSGSDKQSDVAVQQEKEDISPKRKFWNSIFLWIPGQAWNDKTRIRVNTTLTDEAGRLTEVGYGQERKPGIGIGLTDFTIRQDGQGVATSGMTALYDAAPGRFGRGYALLSAFLSTGSDSVWTQYTQRWGQTLILSFYDEASPKREWVRGAVVPAFEVLDGVVKIIVE
ncbi:MAG: hypothetical protein HGA33_01385 [Candidatus Moranbacteria bacterium]|nr:hypothetical protein [Candidatus Moranbacteria bacterium]